MKVTGAGGVGPAVGPRQARGGADGFRIVSPATGHETAPTGAVGGPAGLMGVAALIALQDVGGPLERRRRAVGRGGRILDVLERVKLSLLEGGLDASDLERLRLAVREERNGTDDPALEAVLDEIELRAAVEVAKLERAAYLG